MLAEYSSLPHTAALYTKQHTYTTLSLLHLSPFFSSITGFCHFVFFFLPFFASPGCPQMAGTWWEQVVERIDWSRWMLIVIAQSLIWLSCWTNSGSHRLCCFRVSVISRWFGFADLSLSVVYLRFNIALSRWILLGTWDKKKIDRTDLMLRSFMSCLHNLQTTIHAIIIFIYQGQSAENV